MQCPTYTDTALVMSDRQGCHRPPYRSQTVIGM